MFVEGKKYDIVGGHPSPTNQSILCNYGVYSPSVLSEGIGMHRHTSMDKKVDNILFLFHIEGGSSTASPPHGGTGGLLCRQPLQEYHSAESWAGRPQRFRLLHFPVSHRGAVVQPYCHAENTCVTRIF